MAKHIFCRTTLFVVFMLFFRTGWPDIVVTPSNKEVKLGSSTYFNCSTSVTSEEVHWFHYPVSNLDRSFVYSFNQFQPPYQGRFLLEKNSTTGEYNLVITSVKTEDAGKYECQDNGGRGEKQSAQLITLDTDLVCKSNVNVDKVIGPNACGIKPDQLEFSCMVQYHGNEAPIMQWGMNDSTTPITNEASHQVNGNSVVYNLTITHDQLINGSAYVCQTTRSTTKISCESGKVKVLGPAQEAADGSCNCKSYDAAIICIFLLLILPLCITVIYLSLMLRNNRKPKLPGSIRDCFPCCEKGQGKQVTEPHHNNEEVDNKKQTTEKTTNAEVNDVNKEAIQEAEATNARSRLLENQTGGPSSDSETIIKNLQGEMDALRKCIGRRDAAIKELKRNEDSNAKVINSLHAKVKDLEQLRAKVKDLEQQLYPKENVDNLYKSKVLHTIQIRSSKVDKKVICGIAILHSELFIVFENSKEIEVYDSVTYNPQPKRIIDEMTYPTDITSSKANNCFYAYIIDRVNDESRSLILKINSKDESKSQMLENSKNTHVIKQWPTDGGSGRLSTSEYNVIACLIERNHICEYSGDGILLNRIPLSPAANLNHPWHAIKVTSQHFVVSHGEVGDDVNRVCVVDLDGKVIRECSKLTEKLKVPICLAECSDKFVLVADRDNKQLLLLNYLLKFEQKLIVSDKNGLKDQPVRLALDDKGYLFIAENYKHKKEWQGGRISIFSTK